MDKAMVEPLAKVLLQTEGIRLASTAPQYDALLVQLLEAQRRAMEMLV